MGKKIGNFFLSLTPGIACLVLQIGIAVVISTIYTVIYMAQIDMQAPDAMNLLLQEVTKASSALSVFGYHIVGIIVFGLWYYFGCKRPKPAPLKSMANVKFWGSAFLAALIFITVNYTVMYILSVCFPGMVQQYTEAWAGLEMSNETLLLISTIFLAPIGEEFLMRGVTLYYARQCTRHFWVANVIQAFMFGLIHLNWIQGTYAFLGALILGWLYKKYNSMYIVILVHFLVNLSASTWADSAFGRMPDDLRWWGLLIAGVVAALIALLAWNGEFKKKAVESKAVETL